MDPAAHAVATGVCHSYGSVLECVYFTHGDIGTVRGLCVSYDCAGDWDIHVKFILGSLALYGIGAIIAALLLTSQHNMALLSVLLLPFFIPVMILGNSVVDLAQHGQSVTGLIGLILAYTLFILTVSPFLVASIVRLVVRYDY